jgi:23S rRNA (cytidine1920-2'-O)/16S rRNA (cytidine1409-2'-O)-methyltransferase
VTVATANSTERLDVALVRRGLARSREHASALIATGGVTMPGRTGLKPSTRVSTDTPVTATPTGPSYVSRGGAKLAGALAELGPLGLRVDGRRCLDAGASTGGFTQVLLESGARVVHAVDVGTAQLAPVLRGDPRVIVHDATNVRTLGPATIGGPVDLVVADLSFISLRKVLASLTQCVVGDGDLLPLVKPQFEVGRGRVGPRGVVRSNELRAEAVANVADAAAQLGFGVAGAAVSRLPGPAGNIEYILWLRRDTPPADSELLATIVQSGSG